MFDTCVNNLTVSCDPIDIQRTATNVRRGLSKGGTSGGNPEQIPSTVGKPGSPSLTQVSDTCQSRTHDTKVQGGYLYWHTGGIRVGMHAGDSGSTAPEVSVLRGTRCNTRGSYGTDSGRTAF